MAKNPTFSVRIPADKKDALYQMADSAGIPLATLAQRLLVSALEYYQANGDVPMPPAIVRKSEVARDPFDQIEEFLEHETQNRRMAQLLEKFREQKSKEAI